MSARAPLGRAPHHPRPSAPRRRHDPFQRVRRAAATALSALLALTAIAAGPGATAARADDVMTVDSATFEWGLNDQHQLGAEFGGCDYFSAGLSDGSTAQYQTRSGDVHVIKRSSDGSATAVSQTDRCTPVDEASSDEIGQRLLFSNGTGTTSTTTGETTIRWHGTATVNSYGGLVPWSITDPVLTVDAEGTGQLTATLGGWAASQDDSSKKTALASEPGVVLADFTGVEVTSSGITATPAFTGVDYFPLDGDIRSTVSAISDAVKTQRPDWGSWPQSFVDFQYRTGLASYWHTSGLSSDAKKAPLPVTIAFDGSVPQLAPVVVRDPSDVTLTAGGSASFQVETAGNPTPTIAWESKGTGSGWTAIPGETATTLTLEQVAATDDGRQVRAVVTSTAGTATSAAATLTVEDPDAITIVTQPQSIERAAGAAATLSIEVTGSAPQYQWQRSTDGGATWADWGTTTAQSSRVPTSPENDGDRYRVVVTNGVSVPVVSDVATVTVTTAAVAITQSPVDAMGFVDGKVIFRAYASGAPSPTWRWERSTDDGATWAAWSTDTTSVIYVENLTADMDGDLFRAVASNGYGPDVTTEPRRLTVIPQTERTVLYSPSAVIDPTERTVLALSGAGFSVPDTYTAFLRIGIMRVSDWDPAAPDRTKFLGDYATVYASTLKRDAGAFARTLIIAADALDPAEQYLLVSFSSAAGDTSLNNAVPLVLTGEDLTAEPAPVELDDPSTGTLAESDLGLTTTTAGGDLTVTNLEPLSWFFLTAYSAATPLGWQQTDASGTLTVTVASTLGAGQHTLLVQNTAGIFRAWQGFEVLAADTGAPTGTGAQPVGDVAGSTEPGVPTGGASDSTSGAGTTGTGTTEPGTTGAGTTGRLSSTGLDTVPSTIAALVLLVGGVALVGWRSRTRRSHSR